MSYAAKSTRSIRKKSTANQKSPYVGTKSLMFAHEITSASQTTINLSALNTPSSMLARGFVQPSTGDLATAELLFYRKNLTLMSSLRGDLWDFDSYQVTGSASITLNFTPEVGEIFVGKIADVAKTGLQALDGKALSVTGTLAAGQTDFVVGQSFAVNKYSASQVGDVKVFIDGILQARNSGNAVASTTADGNYQELDAGSGLSNTVRFNQSSTDARSITVVSNGMIVERADGSLRAEIESLAGQLDKIIPAIASATGVAETNFQSAPNNVDLKGFGDRVLALETNRARLDVANTFAGSNLFNAATTFAVIPTRSDALAIPGGVIPSAIYRTFSSGTSTALIVTTIPYALDGIYSLQIAITSNNGGGVMNITFGYVGAGPGFYASGQGSANVTWGLSNSGGFVAITVGITGGTNAFGQYQITGSRV